MPLTFFDPGQLTARLDLETPLPVSDGQGGASMSWTITASLWARIEPVSFVIGEAASAETASISHRIWVPFRNGIAAGQRFRKGTRLFVIKVVRDPDETRRYLVCQCAETV